MLRLPLSPKVFSFSLWSVRCFDVKDAKWEREERGSGVVEKATAVVVQEDKFQKLFAGICIMRLVGGNRKGD
jgi:hypothetical protein